MTRQKYIDSIILLPSDERIKALAKWDLDNPVAGPTTEVVEEFNFAETAKTNDSVGVIQPGESTENTELESEDGLLESADDDIESLLNNNLPEGEKIEYKPGTNIPIDPVKKVNTIPTYDYNDEGNVTSSSELTNLTSGSDRLGNEQLNLLKINNDKSQFDLNEKVKEGGNAIEVRGLELDGEMNTAVLDLVEKQTPNTGIDYSNADDLKMFNNKLQQQFIKTDPTVVNTIDSIKNSPEALKRLEELKKKYKLDYYSGSPALFKAQANKANQEYNEFLGGLLAKDETLTNVLGRFNKQLQESQIPLVSDATKMGMRTDEASEGFFDAEEGDIQNLGFGLNADKLTSVFSGAESNLIRGIEKGLGYQPFELTDSARKGIKMLSGDNFGVGVGMIKFSDENKAFKAWETEGPKGKARLAIDGDNTKVVYNSQTGTIQPSHLYVQRAGRHTTDMTLGEAKKLEQARLNGDYSSLLEKQGQVLEKEINDGNFSTEAFSDWWGAVKNGNVKDALRFIPKQLLEQIPYMASNYFTAGMGTIVTEGGNIYQGIVKKEASKYFGKDESELTGTDMIAYVEKFGDKGFDKAMVAGGFIAAAEAAGIDLMISKGKYMRSAFKEIMKKDFLQGMKQIGNATLRAGGAALGEAGTEGIQTGIEQAAVGEYNGQEYIESMGSGGLMGLVMPTGGAIMSSSVNTLSSIGKTILLSDADTKKNLKQVNEYFKNAEQSIDNQFKAGKITQIEKQDGIENLSLTKNTALQIPKGYDVESRSEIFDLLKEKTILEREILNKDSDLVPNENKRIAEIKSELNQIATTQNKVAIEEDINKVTNIVGKDNIDVYETTEDFIKATGQSGDVDAMFIEKDGRIIINKQRASEVGAVTSANHELLHKITQSIFSNPESATKLIEDFKNTLRPKELSIVEKRINENYKFKRDDNGNILLDKDGKKIVNDKSSYDSEYLTAFSDAIGKGEITWSDNLQGSFRRVGYKIAQFLKLKGFDNVNFETGKDVYDFIRSYASNIKKGKIDAKAQVLLDTEVNVVTDGKVELSKTSPDIVAENKSLSNDLETAIESGDVQAQTDIKNDLFLNNQGIVGDFVKTKFKPNLGITKADFLDGVNEEVLVRLNKTYSPSKGEYGAYVREALFGGGKFGGGRLGNILKDLGQEGDLFNKQIDDQKVGEIIVEDAPVEISNDKSKKTKASSVLSTDSIAKATEQVKSKIKDIDSKNLTFKKIGTLTAEVTAEAIGIPVEKLTNPKKNLSKPEASKAQRFILKNIDNIRRTLPEGSVQQGATEGIIGTSTGVPTSLLKNPKLYTKQARGKKGSGLYAYKLNPGITNVDILEAAGIVDGKMKPGFKPRDGQAVKAIISVVDKNITNELVRTDTDISQTNKVDVGAGRNKAAYSKTILAENVLTQNVFQKAGIENSDSPNFNEYNINYNETLDAFLEGEVDRIDMSTEPGRERFLNFAIESGLTKKLPPSFWISLAYTSENALTKETLQELKEQGIVGAPFTLDGGSLRDFKGNLPFRNTIEARAWITENKSEFAAESDSFNDMIKQEGVFAEKNNLERELNNPEFVKRQDNSIDQLGDIFKIFQNEIMRNTDGTMNFEGVAFVGALLSSSSAGTNHFLRKAAPYRFYQKGYMEAGSSKTTLEHTMPATIVGKYLFMQALDGSIDQNFKHIKNNYFQGPLAKTNDGKLKGKKPNGDAFNYIATMPEGWQVTDNVWARYFNLNVANVDGGINPTNIFTANNKSVFDQFNITPSGLKIAPSQINAYSKTPKFNSKISNAIDATATPQQQTYELGKLDERAAKEIKASFSLTTKQQAFDTIFNNIIESSTGIESFKEYSSARATTIGASKGKFSFFTTPSAEDFVGLLYKTLGKGKVGDAQFQFYKDNLINPYNKAEISVTKAKMAAANDYKALKRNLKTLPNSMSKPTGIGGFTYGQAARVAIWTRQGMEVPGMSKRDIKELNDFVENNKEMNEFANELINIQKGKPYPAPSKEWLGGNITSDILNEINKVNRKQYLQEWQDNIDVIFSDKNMNKLEAAYGPKYVEALKDQIARMKSGSNRPIGGSRIVNQLLDWLNNSVGAVMFLNTRSAVLQTLSAVNFINFGNNNIYKAGKAFANQPQFWSDFKTLMNSNYLTERRNGLKINVSESEIADAVAESSNKPKAAIAYLLNKGFIFTRIADSFAIAVGGASFYRNTIDAYIKQGMEVKAAEKQAFNDFYAIAEESQQSSNPSKISQQQASAAGRVVLAFANTPMQYNRIIKRASQDLINKRGDWKANVSKVVYYAAVQNLMFNALQNALFARAFGEDEDEDEEKDGKEARIANGMADSLLRGLGIQGAVVSALKNSLITIANENDKKSPKFVKAVYDLFDFSPPLDSKFRKLRSGANTITWERENIKNKGFDLNNPAYLAGAQLVSGLTNLPLDRAIQKINNIRAITSNSSQNWQKVAMALGWSTWDVGLPFYGVDDKVEMTPQMILKEKVTTMAKETSTKEQKDLLLELGLTKQQIKALKYEDVRVKKIIELQEKK